MSNENEDMPRLISRVRADNMHRQMVTARGDMEEEQELWSRAADWFWPAMSWMILIINGMILGVAFAEMVSKEYHAFTHLSSMGLTVMSYIACAFTYRYIVLPALLLKRKQTHGHAPATSSVHAQQTSPSYPATS